MATEAMKVGELADRTGLSVRTLHHYDEIGLLAPGRRTAAGHRIYGLAQVRRLQQIASLRHLGLSLEEIRECLERPEYSLDRVLALQVERLRAEIGRQKRLDADSSKSLRRRLARGPRTSPSTTSRARSKRPRGTRSTTRRSSARRSHRGPTTGRRADHPGAQRDGRELFDAFARRHGDRRWRRPPGRAGAGRAGQRPHRAFTGGDEGIRASLARMYARRAPRTSWPDTAMHLPNGLWADYSAALDAIAPRPGGAHDAAAGATASAWGGFRRRQRLPRTGTER